MDTKNANYNSDTYPYQSTFYLDAQNYSQFEILSLVSARFNDIYFNSGYLTLDTGGTWEFL